MILFSALFLNLNPSLTLKGTTRPLNYALHFPSQLRNRTRNFPRQNIPETGKSLGFAFEQLVVLHGVLDKFARVDVRVPSLLDVADDVLRDVDVKVGRGAGENEEVVDKGFAVAWLVGIPEGRVGE